MNYSEFINKNLLIGIPLLGLNKSNKGSNYSWTGFVSTNDGEIPAYIKKCKKDEYVIIEVISALIGIHLNLPIPRPILIKVEPNHPEIPVSDITYLFGSEQSDLPCFEREINDANLRDELIIKYKDLPLLSSFDELIANPDRHGSNILYDGENFRFIDHEFAFAKTQDPRLEINDLHKTETLTDIIRYHKGSNEVFVHDFMNKIRSVLTKNYDTTKIDALLNSTQESFSGNNYNAEIERIRSFISSRFPLLIPLIKKGITNENDSQIDWVETSNA